MSDANFRTALSHLTSIVHLDVTACVPVSDDTLREVGEICCSPLPTMTLHCKFIGCLSLLQNLEPAAGA